MLIHFTVTPRTAAGPPPHQDPTWLFQIVKLVGLLPYVSGPPPQTHVLPIPSPATQNILLLLIATLVAATHPTPLTLIDAIPGADHARTSRVGVHSEQPTVLALRKTDDTRAH